MIEAYLERLTLSGLPPLDSAMHYSLAGGKRIRARLCLAAARAGGADPRSALPAAAALELVQAFSLVHDDLPALDDDTERRGRPTAHVAYGEAVAVLSGDALLNAAHRLVVERLDAAPAVRVAVLAELAAGVAGMIDGQYLDVTAPAQPDLEELRRMHRLKTGALIGAAIGCGLHVAGLDTEQQRPYRAFAEELGLLFQIVDDILDAGSTAEPSYVTAVGLERSGQLAAASHRRAARLLDGAEGDTGELAELTDLIAHRTG